MKRRKTLKFPVEIQTQVLRTCSQKRRHLSNLKRKPIYWYQGHLEGCTCWPGHDRLLNQADGCGRISRTIYVAVRACCDIYFNPPQREGGGGNCQTEGIPSTLPAPRWGEPQYRCPHIITHHNRVYTAVPVFVS